MPYASTLGAYPWTPELYPARTYNPMLSEDRDELLTVAVEFCKNATRSDAQAVIEAWSEDTRTKVARSIEHVVDVAMGSDSLEILVTAYSSDDGISVASEEDVPYGYVLHLVDRDA
jgi:phosphoserine phosphatase